MFRFAASEWLMALLAVPALAVMFRIAAVRRRRALETFAEATLAARLTASVSPGARVTRAVLATVAVSCLVVALARPQFGTRVETVRSVGQDIVVALDLSRSMLAEDISPNRLERARLAILQLVRRLDGDRIGLVAFAADAFVQSPLTVDYGAATMFLSAMRPELMPVQGTDLGAALRVSLDALEEGARESRVVVIVTDGEDHEASFEEQMARAREAGVAVHVVGLGGRDGVPIPDLDEQGRRRGFVRDEDGSVVTTRLEQETVERIVRATGGRFVRAGVGGTAFDDLIEEIAGADGDELEAQQVTLFEEQFQIFAGLALLLLVAEMLIPERRRMEPVSTRRFEP